MAISENDQLLAVRTSKLEEAQLEIWYLPSPTKLTTLAFGPKSVARDHRYRRCKACFTSDGSRLVGGSDDCTMRIWDTRLFCPAPAQQVRSSNPVGDRQKRLTVPRGMQANPEFGKLLHVVEHKTSCKGLHLERARGIATIKIAGREAHGAGQNRVEQEILQWFRERGAVIRTPARLSPKRKVGGRAKRKE